MEARVLFHPVFLILLGVGFLLSNLGLIAMSPWQVFIAYWPLIVVFFGFRMLISHMQRVGRDEISTNSELVISLLVIGVGMFLLAPRMGFNVPRIPWGLFWPLLLIGMGLSKILFSQSSCNGMKTIEKDASEAEGKFSFVGELHRGGSSWTLKDMYLRHLVGEVHLDLTQAIIPDKEVTIDVSGWMGDVNVLLPADLALKVHCSLSMGEIQVLDEKASGFRGVLTTETEGYKEATKKLYLKASWKMGDIKVRRIG